VERSFSTATLRLLLRAGHQGGFTFATFEQVLDLEWGRVCVIRHDVDSDPGAAYAVAELEAEEGVRSTYFVMLRSPVYNVFGRANQELVEQIAALGHAIGLHYDPAFPTKRGRSHTEQIEVERGVLEELLGVPVGAVAFHQPSLVPGAFEIEVEGVVKANGLAGYHFLSDSNQDPRVFETLDVFRSGDPPRLQLLIHPMWWVGAADTPPSALWERSILADWERSQQQLLVERAYGPTRRMRLEPG
jgi:hypothetical protein